MGLGLFIDKTYFFGNIFIQQSSTQYIYTIMQYGIECNIINIAIQLFFAYWGLAPKLWLFVSPPIEWTKAIDFIYVLKEKQEVWYEMMIISVKPPWYYNSK